MIQIEIFGRPVPWTASRSSNGRFYDPKSKEKEIARWQVKAQYQDKPLEGYVHLDFIFYFPIPKNTSFIKRKQMLEHIILPDIKVDTTNLQKFYEDCLKGIVIIDDKNATDTSSRKRYSETARVLIRIIPLTKNIYNPIDFFKDFSSLKLTTTGVLC